MPTPPPAPIPADAGRLAWRLASAFATSSSAAGVSSVVALYALGRGASLAWMPVVGALCLFATAALQGRQLRAYLLSGVAAPGGGPAPNPRGLT
jgi:hypothetical protein